MSDTDVSRDPAPEPLVDEGGVEPEADPAQVAFDINDFPGGLRGAVEAVLMVVDEPLPTVDLATALEQPVEDIEKVVRDLEAEYLAANRGFALRQVAGGWRVYSRPEYAPVVEKFLLEGQQARLTQAALETLAVVAYRQPISRSRVGAVRGVNVDGVVRTLLARGLIVETGHDETTNATLYGTTDHFLERLGLSSLDDLPALAPYLPEVDVIDDIAEEGRW